MAKFLVGSLSYKFEINKWNNGSTATHSGWLSDDEKTIVYFPYASLEFDAAKGIRGLQGLRGLQLIRGLEHIKR